MIVATGLVYAYRKKPVLHGVTFTARPGEITLLVGSNGAGKSTTLKVLAGLVRPDRGEASIAGRDLIRQTIAAQRELSFLPQTPNFHPRFTCAQIVDFYAGLRGIAPSRRAAVLEAVGLSAAAHEPTRTLSGGMRQRLGLALLLLPDAPVLLLDEPGLSLDPEWRGRLQEILRSEAEFGKTVLVTTHLLAEWNNVAHRCLLCRAGVIESSLDPANLSAGFSHDAGAPSGNGQAVPADQESRSTPAR